MEARETERQEFLQKAAVAAKARQEVRRQRVESQRARVEQRRQVALASQQRAQERARARQQAQQEWEQQRAARRDTARQERREAQLVRERQHRAWAAINLRVSTERRQGVWHYANQQYQGERRFAVRAELRRHARKTEYLDRLRSAASEVNEPQLLERVAIMFNEEGVRHQHRMDRLGASLTRQ